MATVQMRKKTKQGNSESPGFSVVFACLSGSLDQRCQQDQR